MDFRDADRQYEELKEQFQAGAITAEEFDERLHALAVLDDQGRWWAKSRDTGQWNYHDGTAWISGDPYRVSEPAPPPPQPEPQPQPAGISAFGPVAALSPDRSVSQGVALALYALAIVVPIAGAILWLVYRNNPLPGDRSMAKHFGIIAIVWFVLFALMQA